MNISILLFTFVSSYPFFINIIILLFICFFFLFFPLDQQYHLIFFILSSKLSSYFPSGFPFFLYEHYHHIISSYFIFIINIIIILVYSLPHQLVLLPTLFRRFQLIFISLSLSRILFYAFIISDVLNLCQELQLPTIASCS